MLKIGICFQDVWFKYPGSKDWIIKGVSFSVKPGETISLVGANGAGKITLLMGLYKPQKGKILYDNILIEEIKEDSLRANISAIFQDFVRFEFSLGENIGLGNFGGLDSMNKIKEVARLSGLDKWSGQLAHGYSTILSKAYGGTELSRGTMATSRNSKNVNA